MDSFIGTIILFAGNFAPRGWAFCQGQLLPIQQYTAVFSLLGTTYGGNGVQTFGLPNLQGRVPVGSGSGAGLSKVDLGQMLGTENVTLLTTQIPAHTHPTTVAIYAGKDTTLTNTALSALFVSVVSFPA